MSIVAFLELSNSDPNLGEVLEADAPTKDLLLERPIEQFGNAAGSTVI